MIGLVDGNCLMVAARKGACVDRGQAGRPPCTGSGHKDAAERPSRAFRASDPRLANRDVGLDGLDRGGCGDVVLVDAAQVDQKRLTVGHCGLNLEAQLVVQVLSACGAFRSDNVHSIYVFM